MVGRTVLENLLHPCFQGKVYAVNSRHSEICGLKAYPRIGDVPENVDLAVVATPAATVPQVIGECVDAGVFQFDAFRPLSRNPAERSQLLTFSVVQESMPCWELDG